MRAWLLACVLIGGLGLPAPGISHEYPIVTTSSFQGGVHSLGPVALGSATEAYGAVSSPFHRLPLLTELRLGGAALRSGTIDIEGAGSGLALDVGALELAGEDRFVLGWGWPRRSTRCSHSGPSSWAAAPAYTRASCAPPS